MLDEDRIRIRHMLDAAEEVIGFTSGRERTDLDNDRMVLFAVVRGIEIIGEAATKVSSRDARSLPRDSMAGDRHDAPQAHPWLLRR